MTTTVKNQRFSQVRIKGTTKVKVLAIAQKNRWNYSVTMDALCDYYLQHQGLTIKNGLCLSPTSPSDRSIQVD